jgi:hypothetical protein
MIMSRDLAAVAAERHAAPVPGMVLGRVVEEEHASRILTFFD